GGYVANDAAQSVFALNTEQGDANTAAQFQSDWGFPLATSGATGAGWANDVQTIVGLLSVVDNNGPSNIGGGGTPRQPLAAPLATSCLTAARLTAATPAFDPDGDGDNDFVDPPPTASPTPTPTQSPSPTATPDPSPSTPPSPTPTGCASPTPSSPSATPTPPPSSTPLPTPTPSPSPSPTLASGTPHVLYIIEENKGYAATLGTCSADPYLCSLAASYTSFTDWHGVSHPLQPNYFALTSGSTQGCTSDSCGKFNGSSLGQQLDTAGVPWAAWIESMPSPCSIGSLAPLKHNPFESSTALTDCATHDTPYPGVAGAVSALTGTHAPSFVWITPNLNDDMHNGTVQQGDAWLKANLAPILASSWFTGFNSTVVVGMDEGDAGSTNQIPTVVISNNA